MKEYYLFLITDTPLTNNYLENKHLVFGGSLQEIDEITIAYQNAQDFGNEINTSGIAINFIGATIISKSNIQNMQKNNTSNPPKNEKVLFQEDKEFIEKITTIKSYENILIEEYKNFLLNHRREIKESLVKNVKIGPKIEENIPDNILSQAFYSYYKNKTYKKVRDTYLELKKERNKYIRVRRKK